MSGNIGTLAEKSLHAALKKRYAQPSDKIETPVDGYVIDIVRGELLIEIQTRSFSALKRKLTDLLKKGHRVHLIHPIAAEKMIVKENEAGKELGRRRSPRKGRVLDIFNELLRIPALIPAPGLSIEVVLTHQEEIRRNDGQGSWRRRGWSLHDHRLVDIVDQAVFSDRVDYLRLIPPNLETPFTTRQLAKNLKIPVKLAQKMAYTLHKAGWLDRVGKSGNAYLYTKIEI